MQKLPRKKIAPQLIVIGLLVLIIAITTLIANNPIHLQSNSQFSQIAQPFLLKMAVTLGGLILIYLELSWFLFSQDKVQSKLASQIFTLFSNLLKQLPHISKNKRYTAMLSFSSNHTPTHPI